MEKGVTGMAKQDVLLGIRPLLTPFPAPHLKWNWITVTLLWLIFMKLRMNYIRILPGDRVSLELSPYDLKRANNTAISDSSAKDKSLEGQTFRKAYL